MCGKSMEIRKTPSLRADGRKTMSNLGIFHFPPINKVPLI